MLRFSTYAVAASLIVTAMTGCASNDTPTADGSTPASGQTSSTKATPAPSDTASSSPGTSAAGLPDDHSVCTIISVQDAGGIMGGSGKQLQVPDTSDKVVTHVDRCTVQTANASLGYQVDRYSKPLPMMMIQAMKAKAKQGTPFPVPGGSHGIGFVINVGGKAMARVFIALPGNKSIDVSATAGSPAQARKIAEAVTERLYSAAG